VEKAVKEAQEQEVILLGDFNCHHPAWGGRGTATEKQADHLLKATQGWNLSLETPPGEPTWRRGLRESVIDLTFISEALQQHLEFCGTKEEWAVTADHIPILISIGGASETQSRSKRFNIRKLDTTRFRAEVEASGWYEKEEPLTALQDTIQVTLEKLCPRLRYSEHAKREWSPEATTLLRAVKQARRRYNASRTQ
jgi:hypothetical protein